MTRMFDTDHALNQPRRPVLATLITADLDKSLSAYRDLLDYTVVETCRVTVAMAQHFGAGSLAGNDMAILAPKSGAPVFLRVIEAREARPPQTPQCGWFALEICVQNVEKLYEALKTSGLITPFSPPKPLAFTDRVYPMQCRGPSGEIIYLNEVKGSLPDIDLPIAGSPVDHLFIAILSASDMESASEYYANLLDMTVNERHEIPYKTINRVHGLPLDTLHKLLTLGGRRSTCLEIDQWPAAAGDARPQALSDLSEGIFMVSFTVESLPQNSDNCLGPALTLEGMPYDGAASLITVGPAGERTELIHLAQR